MDDRHRKKVESLIKLSFGTFLAISIPGSVHAPPPDTPPYTQPIIEQDFQSSLLVLRSQCGLSTIFVQAGASREINTNTALLVTPPRPSGGGRTGCIQVLGEVVVAGKGRCRGGRFEAGS